jgi:hypothetical protein
MSLFSRIFGQKPALQDDAPCAWMQSNLHRGLSPDEIGAHIDRCPVCGPLIAARRHARGGQPRITVPTDKVPTALMIGLEGPLDLRGLLDSARKEDREVIAMGNNSPAFKDLNVLVREMSRFTDDPSLVLVFEKWPSRENPFCMDPLIIVRRSFFLAVGPSLEASTSGELAIRLAMAAGNQQKRVGYV